MYNSVPTSLDSELLCEVISDNECDQIKPPDTQANDGEIETSLSITTDYSLLPYAWKYTYFLVLNLIFF